MSKLKILIEGKKERYEKYYKDVAIIDEVELIFYNSENSLEQIVEKGSDAQVLFVDAISVVDEHFMNHFPKLKMIHSEGVGYNGIDLEAANKLGIYVCNNKGCNARAVAEQTIMLMLMLLRNGIVGDAAVRAGQQGQMKDYYMTHGITELGECKIGLIGFGDIAKETAKRLHAFDCEVYYFTPKQKEKEIEEKYHVSYLHLNELASSCDIISIHTAVTEETTEMIDESFLAKMKNSAYIINTARGEIVDNIAMREALIIGRIAGAGMDTIHPEPTLASNPLVNLPEEHKNKSVLSPHLGGITTASFKRGHQNMWHNVERLIDGQTPSNVVNGVR